MRPLLIASLLVLGGIRSTDAVVLVAERGKDPDRVTLLLEDSKLSYMVEEIEAAALEPYCLTLTTSASGVRPVQAWHDCFSSGRLDMQASEFAKLPPLPGGGGRLLTLTITSPLDARAVAIAKLTVRSEPQPAALDAGPHDAGAIPLAAGSLDAGARPDGGAK